MESEVYVHRRSNYNGHLRLIATFKSLEDLTFHTRHFDNFSCNSNDRCTYDLHNWDKDFNAVGWERVFLHRTTSYCYVVYNSNDKIVPPDVLVGVDRNRRWNRYERWMDYRRFSGRRRGTYGFHRRPNTHNERKQVEAWDGEEFAPKVRCKRNLRSLPDSWWDIHRSVEHNWKSQRKTQWK